MVVEEVLVSRNVFGDGAVHGMRGVVVGLVMGCGADIDGCEVSCWYRAATAGVSSTYSRDTSAYLVPVYFAVAGYQRTCIGWTAVLWCSRGMLIFSARAVEESQLGSRANASSSRGSTSGACWAVVVTW